MNHRFLLSWIKKYIYQEAAGKCSLLTSAAWTAVRGWGRDGKLVWMQLALLVISGQCLEAPLFPRMFLTAAAPSDSFWWWVGFYPHLLPMALSSGGSEVTEVNPRTRGENIFQVQVLCCSNLVLPSFLCILSHVALSQQQLDQSLLQPGTPSNPSPLLANPGIHTTPVPQYPCPRRQVALVWYQTLGLSTRAIQSIRKMIGLFKLL